MNRQLEYLKYVANYGSLLKASEKLYITPSALSKYIQKTESDLEVQLFDRIGKKFVLTYAGERYLNWLEKIDVLENEMTLEIHDIAKSYQGRIRIGIQLTAVDNLIYNILPKFYEKFPGIMVEIIEDTSNNLRQQLEDNQLDLALMPSIDIPSTLEAITLAENLRVLVVPDNHELLEKAKEKKGFDYPWIDVNLLKDYSFVSPFQAQDAYKPFSQIEREQGFKLNIIARMTTMEAMLKCVGAGIGLTISSDQNVKSNQSQSGINILSFGSHPHISDFIIAYHKDHYLDAASTEFISITKELYS